LLLQIEKLIYGGDGLARLPADASGRGKAVFLPFVLPGETVEASLTPNKNKDKNRSKDKSKAQPGFARAQAEVILKRSPHRVDPACPYFFRCGGCHYQHSDYEHQLDIKKDILRETLRRIAKIDLLCEIHAHPSPPWNYRNRSRLQVRTRPDFFLGYFKFASHELLPIDQCPISSPLINRAIAAIHQLGRGNRVPDSIREIEFFAGAEDTSLLLEIFCTPDAKRSAIRAFGEDLSASMPEIAGVLASCEPQKGVPEGVRDSLFAIGAQHLSYKTRHANFRVGAGAFFQTNRFLVDELISIVTAGRSGELALDLYAGVGLFSTALACNFRHVVSVESSQTAVIDLAYNLPTNGKAVRSTTEQYLSQGLACAGTGNCGLVQSLGELEKGRVGKGKIPQKYLHTPDLIVADPPRSGLGNRVARALASARAPRVTYVSCDPATLARDLVLLQSAGYRVEQLHLVDLFPQTYHLESVAQLVR
jgi:23S rRNA (uracil1939-C5)-methyltransferase